ncbi:hypothetical protein [Lysinibacillus piscis]|uniref:Uncharacterized protein n=1 Tax=Lysinibacillus piscis TaxID=2518931 RepID=A0ABQ5NFF7_9BACI|nr:hypothetical protein [Lysinibacillus sp. KH24]GLC87115.1 hypothetical protein LYSBPC_02420 [Lysinibacillus sp. KH24]
MMRVQVKAKDIRLSIPVPYILLNMAVAIICSALLQKMLNKWTQAYFEKHKVHFTFPVIDKTILQPIVKELKNYRGMVLVDVKAQDGTEVKVRL